MNQPGYGEHIAHVVGSLPYGMAIQTDDIAQQLALRFSMPYGQAKAATNVKLKRMADGGEIERLQKGVYCHVKQTVFGKVTPDLDEMMMKTLTVKGGTRIGYESGPSLLNRLGLTTLIPREIEITTNSFGKKLPQGCHIRLRKPTAPVTDTNWSYLRFLDALRELQTAHSEAEAPEKVLRQLAERDQLDILTMILTARKYYPAKTVLHAIDLFMEV